MASTEVQSTMSPYHRWIKPRMDADPEFKKLVIKRIHESIKKRYAEDPEFRAKQDEKTKIAHRRRYAEDPEYRQRKIDQAKARNLKIKLLKAQNAQS